MMTSEETKVVELELRYGRLLAALERAYAIGDDDDVAMLFSGIDPIDLRLNNDLLDALLKVWAGTTDETDGSSDAAHPPSLALVSEAADPSAPSTGPESFSVRVPPPCE